MHTVTNLGPQPLDICLGVRGVETHATRLVFMVEIPANGVQGGPEGELSTRKAHNLEPVWPRHFPCLMMRVWSDGKDVAIDEYDLQRPVLQRDCCERHLVT